MQYAFGVTDTRPEPGKLGIDPNRVRGLVRWFLRNRGVTIRRKADPFRAQVEAHIENNEHNGSTELSNRKEKSVTEHVSVGRDLVRDIIPPLSDGILWGLGIDLDLNERHRAQGRRYAGRKGSHA